MPSVPIVTPVCISRFDSPASWLAYKLHLRRGGVGSDLKKKPAVSRELTRLAKSLEAGQPFALSSLPGKRRLTGLEWWELLTTDVRFRDQLIGKPR